MPSEHLDISFAFTWEEGLPRPQWDLLDTWIEARVPPDQWGQAWSSIARQWLEELGHELGPDYVVAESEDCLLLLPQPEPPPNPLLQLADKCRQTLVTILPGVADFQFAGKQVVMVLENQDD